MYHIYDTIRLSLCDPFMTKNKYIVTHIEVLAILLLTFALCVNLSYSENEMVYKSSSVNCKELVSSSDLSIGALFNLFVLIDDDDLDDDSDINSLLFYSRAAQVNFSGFEKHDCIGLHSFRRRYFFVSGTSPPQA